MTSLYLFLGGLILLIIVGTLPTIIQDARDRRHHK